mgnify:CR=1 FL=1
MTYKSIVENIVKISAERYIVNLLETNKVRFYVTDVVGKPTLNADNKNHYYDYDVIVRIYKTQSSYADVVVRGWINEYGYTASAVVRHGDKIIWIDTDSHRQALGIDTFKI